MKGAGGTVNAKPTAPGRPADPEKRKSLGIEIPSPSAIRKKSESAGTTPTRPAVKRSLSFKTMVGMADPSSKYLASDPEAEASSPVDKPTSPPRGISVHNVALEAAATQTARATTRVPALRAANPERLTLSLAESLMFRGAIKPITFGGKLWLSYRFVVWTKTLGDGARAGTAKTRGRTRGRRSGKSTDVVVR